MDPHDFATRGHRFSTGICTDSCCHGMRRETCATCKPGGSCPKCGSTNAAPQLAQELNRMRHSAPQQQPDYAEFGKACVKILRGPLGGANACINAVTLLLVASKNFGIDLRSEV